MTTARHRCFSLLMAKDQFTSYMTSHYDITQQRRSWASNPRLLDRKSDALPLSHRATHTIIPCGMMLLCCLLICETER